MDVGKSRICSEGSRLEAQERHWFRKSLEAISWRMPSNLGEVIPFVLFRPSTDSMGPTHTGKAIFFILSINLNVNLIQKHAHRNSQNNFWANMQAPMAQGG